MVAYKNIFFGFMPILVLATFFSGSIASYAASLNINPTDIEALSLIKTQASQSYKDWQDANSALESKRSELNILNKNIAELSKQISATQDDLKKLEDIERQNPGFVNPSKLTQARSDNSRLITDRQQKNQQAQKVTDEIATLEEKVRLKVMANKSSQDSYSSKLNTLTDREVNQRKASYQKAQSVEVSGTVSCGSSSVSDCKEKSLKEAERLAIERGSLIYVSSISEINNSKLTKDQIRSATTGQISNRQILESVMINDYSAFKTTIRADVTPVLGSELLASLRTSAQLDIENQIGGGISSLMITTSKLTSPAIIDSSNTPKYSLSELQKQCDNRTPIGCLQLGNAYRSGNGVTQDHYKATEFFKKGCDLGNFASCNNLGISYRMGHGVNQDYYKAALLFKKSCEASDLQACGNLAQAYSSGQGIKKDNSAAALLYKKLCDNGLTRGCSDLEKLSSNGSTVNQDLYAFNSGPKNVRLVYDPELNLTWADTTPATLVDWNGAQNWITGLNLIKYGGYDDWRLPTGDSTVMEHRCTIESNNELGCLFYNKLGAFVGKQVQSLSPFNALNKNQIYWSSSASYDHAWYFNTLFSSQFYSVKTGYYKALAVRKGGPENSQ